MKAKADRDNKHSLVTQGAGSAAPLVHWKKIPWWHDQSARIFGTKFFCTSKLGEKVLSTLALCPSPFVDGNCSTFWVNWALKHLGKGIASWAPGNWSLDSTPLIHARAPPLPRLHPGRWEGLNPHPFPFLPGSDFICFLPARHGPRGGWGFRFILDPQVVSGIALFRRCCSGLFPGRWVPLPGRFNCPMQHTGACPLHSSGTGCFLSPIQLPLHSRGNNWSCSSDR